MLDNQTIIALIITSLAGIIGLFNAFFDFLDKKEKISPKLKSIFTRIKPYKNFSIIIFIISLAILLGMWYTNSVSYKQEQINYFLAEAEQAFEQKLFRKAEIYYKKVLTIAPNNAVALKGGGRNYEDWGRESKDKRNFEKAKESYTRLLNLNNDYSNDLSVIQAICNIDFEMGDFKEGEKSCQSWVEIAQKNGDIMGLEFYLLGNNYLGMWRKNNDPKTLEKAIEATSRAIDAQKVYLHWSHYNMACIYSLQTKHHNDTYKIEDLIKNSLKQLEFAIESGKKVPANNRDWKFKGDIMIAQQLLDIDERDLDPLFDKLKEKPCSFWKDIVPSFNSITLPDGKKLVTEFQAKTKCKN